MTDRWHILSPRASANGRGPLCGAPTPWTEPYFDTPNEAYMAHIEGWRGISLPCKACVDVFLIAIKVNESTGEQNGAN